MKTTTRVFLVIAAVCFLAPPVFGRTWTALSGQTFEGEMVTSDGDQIDLRGTDGKIIEVKVSFLSEEDREYARRTALLAKGEKIEAATARIDSILQKTWQEKAIQPNRPLTDHMFLRRVYLDIAGTIPTYEQILGFQNNADRAKREQLVDELVLSDGYVSHLYNYLADLFRIQETIPGTHLRLDPFAHWLKTSLHSNMPYDRLVHSMITAEGSMQENPAAGYHLRDHGMKLDHVAYMTKAFLGTDIACAQCHDHPREDWTQMDYYKFSAFLGELETFDESPMQSQAAKAKVAAAEEAGKTAKLKKDRGYLYPEVKSVLIKERGWDPDNTSDKRKLTATTTKYLRQFRNVKQAPDLSVSDSEGQQLTLPDTYEYADANPGDSVPMEPLFGSEVPTSGEGKPRHRLANWLASGDNKVFAATIANHMWSRFFGRAVVEPLYDADLTKADPQELIIALQEEMVNLDFDLAAFTRMIVSTDAYNRLATQVEEADDYYFPGPVLRRMSSEQLWDSLMTLMVEDPMRFRASDGKSFQKVIDIAGELDGITGQSLFERVDTFLAYNPLKEMVDSSAGRAGRTLADQQEREQRGIEDPEDPGDQMFMTGGKQYGSKILLTRASELPQPASDSHFLQKFGQSDRDFIIDAASRNGSVPQIMEMMNGFATESICKSESLLFQKIKNAEGNDQKAAIVFMSILNRRPTSEELTLLEEEIKDESGQRRLIWALLNTPEFFFLK